MNILDEINLSMASKYLVSLILKKGGRVNEISGTNAYIIKFKKKEHVFLGEFTPLTPYMYGIVFSNQKYWFEMIKELKIKTAWGPTKKQKKIMFMITGNGFYNALAEEATTITGNGKDSLKSLIKAENIRRINSKNKLTVPIKIGDNSRISWVPKKDEVVNIPGNFEYKDITHVLNKNIIRKMKKVIGFFPGLIFLKVELFVKNYADLDTFTIGKVMVSPGENILLNLTDGKAHKDTGNTLLEYLAR